MYTCDQALELLSARLDGALTPEETAGLEEHLAQCPECRALAADLETLHDAMPELYQEPPAQLKERVMAQIRAESAPISLEEVRKKRSGRKTWRSWGAMAAVMAVVFMSAVAMRFGSGDTAGIPENGPVPSAAVYSAQPEASQPAGAEAGEPAQAEAPESRETTVAENGGDDSGASGTQQSQPAQAGVQSADGQTSGRAGESGNNSGVQASQPPQGGQTEQPAGDSRSQTYGVTPFRSAEPEENGAEKQNADALPNQAMLTEEPETGSAQPQPGGTLYYASLPEGWEKLFPNVAGVDAMWVTGEEAQAFLALLEEQDIPYAAEGDLSGESGDVQLLAGLPE